MIQNKIIEIFNINDYFENNLKINKSLNELIIKSKNNKNINNIAQAVEIKNNDKDIENNKNIVMNNNNIVSDEEIITNYENEKEELEIEFNNLIFEIDDQKIIQFLEK